MPADVLHEQGGTISQAVLLVGGLGSRLGPLTAAMPKPLLEVGGRPFLTWLLRELCRYGVDEALLLAGFQADTMRAALPSIAAGLPRPMRLEVIEEPMPAGTGGALHHARFRLADRFLLLNGDSLFDINLAGLLADAANDAPDVVGRLLLRPAQGLAHRPGRYGVVRLSGERVVTFAERADEDGGPCMMHAGIAVLSRSVAERAGPIGSLEADVFPALAAEGSLRASTRAGWFIDIGVPDDLAQARAELRARLLGRPALILDRDGVLNVDHGYVGARDRFEWNPGARAAVREACDRGWHVFLATNQSGVARGLYDEAAVQSLYRWMLGDLHAAGGTLDDWRYCPHHPEGSVARYAGAHHWRKPAPGMLVDMMRCWQLDPRRCLMVGDQPTDMQAAAAAGIQGFLYSGGDLRDFVLPLLDRSAALVA